MTSKRTRERVTRSQAVQVAHLTANWSPVEQLYPQVGDAIDTARARNSSFALPDVLVGALAVRLGRICASYAGRENQFITDATAVLGASHSWDPDEETAFSELYGDRRFSDFADYLSAQPRRRPTPFETAVETARRLRDLKDIRTAFQRSRTNTAAILGGSLSYGRFFNVRGGNRNDPSSDVDMLIIVPEPKDVERLPGILRRVKFIFGPDLDLMSDRYTHYIRAEQDSEHPMLFSQKVRAWRSKHDPVYPDEKYWGEYGISIHVTSRSGFERIVAADRAELKDDEKSIIMDFRTNVPAEGIARGFDGIEDTFNHTVVKDGENMIARFRVFDTMNGRYKPGLHQQLVLPNFEGRWSADDFDIALPLLSFKWKLLERLRLERHRAPYRVQNLSLTHIRYQSFAPHVRRRTDALELES